MSEETDQVSETVTRLLNSLEVVERRFSETGDLPADQLIDWLVAWQEMVRELAIERTHLREKLRHADEATSEFISFVAHELRTPMTSIRGYSDMLARGMVGQMSDQQAEFVSTIRKNAERMEILVADLQDVSLIETGQLRLERKPMAFHCALDAALQVTESQIEDRSQAMTVEVADDLPHVYADHSRVTQILTNLLSNASKYTPEGGSIALRASVDEREDGSVFRCAIADDGIGISEADQAQLFNKFFRSSNQAVRDMPGTGLGLCIVKSLVELQGGTVMVESELGKGSTFTLTLPLAREA